MNWENGLKDSSQNYAEDNTCTTHEGLLSKFVIVLAMTFFNVCILQGHSPFFKGQ